MSKSPHTSPQVLIIGAGATGLYAGFLLQEAGVPFRILEAAATHGGRLGKLTDFADFPLDTGAQWLHGLDSVAGELARSKRAGLSLDNNQRKYWFEGKLVKELPHSLEIFEGKGLPDISFLAFVRKLALEKAYEPIITQIAGDYGASPDKLSVGQLNQEEEQWSSGSHDYKFDDTFFDLIDRHLAAPIREHIQLDTIIKTVDYQGELVLLSDQQGRSYAAEHCIITVPLPILRDGDIHFSPPLPAAQTEAFAKIGMEGGMKVFLKFREAFYDGSISGGACCAAYYNEKMGKSGQDHVLLAYLMGQQYEDLKAKADTQDSVIVDTLIAELDRMYGGQASTHFLGAYAIDWGAAPFIRGAYSYSAIGQGDARAIAAQTVAEKLFFAGEAMNLNGHHQTVQGAMETAAEVVGEILRMGQELS